MRPKRNIQRQWAEAKRTGKQEELIERWKTRLLLEIGIFAIGVGELKSASSAAKELRAGQLLEDNRLRRLGKSAETADSEAVPATKEAVRGQEISRPLVNRRKFSDYIFKEGADHGKDRVFRGMGYDKADSEELASLYESQGTEKYKRGDYTLGKSDQHGQRINIEIELPGKVPLPARQVI